MLPVFLVNKDSQKRLW